MNLSGKARRYLRGLAHALEPTVHVGKAGVDDRVIRAVSEALETHELIKVKLLPETPMDRHEAAALLGAGTHAEVVQVLGRLVLLYRARPKDPTIVLPKGTASSE